MSRAMLPAQCQPVVHSLAHLRVCVRLCDVSGHGVCVRQPRVRIAKLACRQRHRCCVVSQSSELRSAAERLAEEVEAEGALEDIDKQLEHAGAAQLQEQLLGLQQQVSVLVLFLDSPPERWTVLPSAGAVNELVAGHQLTARNACLPRLTGSVIVAGSGLGYGAGRALQCHFCWAGSGGAAGSGGRGIRRPRAL